MPYRLFVYKDKQNVYSLSLYIKAKLHKRKICKVGNRRIFLISNFRRVLNGVCFLLGNFPVSEFYMPKFWNTLSLTEQMECSEMSAYTIQTLGNYPEESIQQVYIFLEDVYMIIFNCCLVKYGCSAVWASDVFTNDQPNEEVFHIIPPVLTLQCLLHNFNWHYNPWWVLACRLLHISNIKAHVLLPDIRLLKTIQCMHSSVLHKFHI